MSRKIEHFIRSAIAVILVLSLTSSYGNGKEYKEIVDWVLDSETFRTVFKLSLLILACYLAWGKLRSEK